MSKALLTLLLFFFISSPIYAQQFLWSSVKNDSIDRKYVPINNVTQEVLKFYDHYEMHYDLTGFSKERFMSEIDYGFESWDWLKEIEDLTVFAMKSNTGQGSFVFVMCISNENIDMVIFTNGVLDRNRDYIFNIYREKFATWFKTLLN